MDENAAAALQRQPAVRRVTRTHAADQNAALKTELHRVGLPNRVELRFWKIFN